jgi:hypothetical protein
MRTVWFAACAVAGVLLIAPLASAGQYTSFGVYSGQPSVTATQFLARHPISSPAAPEQIDALADAVTQFLLAAPALVDDIIYLATLGSLELQNAVGTGVGRAIARLRDQGNTAVAIAMGQAVLLSGNLAMVVAANAAAAGTVVAGILFQGLYLPSANPSTVTNNTTASSPPPCGTVSPTSPSC